MAELDAVSLYVELSAAIGEQQSRCLQQSVKWAAEQLVGLPEAAFEAGAQQAAEARARSWQPEHPRLVQGRSYFDLKEYLRAAHVLAGIDTPVAVFLRCYALYLAGEKRKEEQRVEASGPLGSAVTANPHLDQVSAELEAATAAGLLAGDGYALYLQALLAIEQDHKPWARQLLVQSLNACPCHWGAWQALTGLCEDLEDVSRLALPGHWARHFFLAALCLELQHNAEALSRLQVINQHNAEALSRLEVVNQLFPGSDWVAANAALAHYNMRNFDKAQALYEDLLARDPARLAGMDTYSNILFVKEAFAPLSHLAHRLAGSDKYTPEACCVIGNYYSLKGQHERAVEYFRRALRLSRTYLSAWTLMGHEYVEMKNAPAAIDAYRSAVALNPRDYRAWYGLGQTYELLSMPFYALHYYRRAALLRPSDPRMWCALGHCYESEGLGLPGLAVRCYRRAVAHGDREGIGLAKLAKLHEAQGERATAAHYYALNLARLDAERVQGGDVTEALLFLAEYAKDMGMLAEAEAYCQRLMDVGGPANMRAKAILRELRSSRSSAAAAAAAAAQAAGLVAAAAAGTGDSGRGRAVLGARRVLGEATGSSSWLSQAGAAPPAAAAAAAAAGTPLGGVAAGTPLAQRLRFMQAADAAGAGYASPAAGNTPGNFSVAMDDEDDEDDDDRQLLADMDQVTPPAAEAEAALAAAAAAAGANLMQLLGSDFSQQTGAAAGARFRAQLAAPGQQQLGGRGLGFDTPGSDMDMMTPAAAGAGRGAVRGGLFDTPVEGAAGGQQQQQLQQQGDESPSTPT
ncbi:hypothetical protein OEZ86_013138 [Tetradesmus obliquus]|nr:hypothetical protein OEZ86_013138 [Tetradesmus obliquus]